ncbi:MAG: AAA family ATPase, partial [Vicinamibacterales bacterium]
LNSVARTLNASSAILTYEPYYGLREKPFSLSTDPKFLYKSAAHAGTFEDLLLAIRRREGLIVLTGDIGTGKTTLCKAVLEHLDRKTFTTFVPDPFVTREALLKMLLLDFGVMSIDDLKSGRMTGASHPDLSYPLCDFLKSLVPLQAFAVLIIDEAQNLSPALLEEIRILSDLEAPDKLLQVVLVGQLELRAKLKLPEMRQLDQRVSARCSLEPLNREAVAGYISHRLSVAGGASDRVHFSPDAIDAIFRVAGGNPRVVNLICDRSLHRGHLARKSTIDAETVTQAIDDLGVGTLTAAPSFLTSKAPAPVAPGVATAVPNAPAAPTLPAAPSALAVPMLPVSTTSLVSGAASSDLSGLEVHDIEGSADDTPMHSVPLYPKSSIFGERRQRTRFRWRVLRWAASLAIVGAIVFFALLGEALFIHTFPPLAEQDLRLPAAPSPSRVPATNTPVSAPADVTQRPPLPEVVRVEPGVLFSR